VAVRAVRKIDWMIAADYEKLVSRGRKLSIVLQRPHELLTSSKVKAVRSIVVIVACSAFRAALAGVVLGDVIDGAAVRGHKAVRVPKYPAPTNPRPPKFHQTPKPGNGIK
jgi:hypothetical protein